MASLIPESATRLQSMVFVKDAELKAIGRGEIILRAAEQMAHSALRKIVDDCVKSEGEYLGYQGQTLKLDVYVLSPNELHKMLIEARAEGERDALRWVAPNRPVQRCEQRKLKSTTNR